MVLPISPTKTYQEAAVLHPQQHYFSPCRQDQHDFLLQRHCGLQRAEQRPLPTTLDSLVGPPASLASVLLGSPSMSPQPPPRSRSFCCCPQVFGTPDQISNDEVCIPRLHGPFPPHPFAHAARPSPADSADKVLIPCFLHRAARFASSPSSSINYTVSKMLSKDSSSSCTSYLSPMQLISRRLTCV
jgi:hypothetical protein